MIPLLQFISPAVHNITLQMAFAKNPTTWWPTARDAGSGCSPSKVPSIISSNELKKKMTLHTFETGIFRIWILATLSDALSRLKNTCCGTFVTSTPFTLERKKVSNKMGLRPIWNCQKITSFFVYFFYQVSEDSSNLEKASFLTFRHLCDCRCARAFTVLVRVVAYLRVRAPTYVRLLCLVRISNASIGLYLENVVSNFHVIFLQYTPILYFFYYDSCNSVN